MRVRRTAARAAAGTHGPERSLYRQTLLVLAAAGTGLVLVNIYAAKVATLGLVSALTSVAVYAAVGGVIVSRILSFHPHPAFGWPNTVTLLRTVLAALVGGYTAEISLWTLSPSTHLAWTFAIVAVVCVALDGVDGWLARNIGPRSAFGARFDMESDALLILILSVLALVLGKVGAWVIFIGALRYLFVAASYIWAWIDRPLPPSLRRNAVCIAQGISLSLLAMPPVAGDFATAIAAAALVLIVWSFAIDVIWLYRHRGDAAIREQPR